MDNARLSRAAHLLSTMMVDSELPDELDDELDPLEEETEDIDDELEDDEDDEIGIITASSRQLKRLTKHCHWPCLTNHHESLLPYFLFVESR